MSPHPPDVVMSDPLGSTHSGMSRPSATVLFVETEEEVVVCAEGVLRARIPDVQFQRARTVSEARRLVFEGSIDLIVAHFELPDGNCGDLLDLADAVQGVLPVVAYVRGDETRVARVREMHPGLFACTGCDRGGAYLERVPVRYLQAIAQTRVRSRSGASGSPEVLRRVRHTISRVNHDLNNPLSIISGNAQLLVELANAMNLDADLLQPIHDIEEASARVAGILRRLVDLKEQLPVDEEAPADVRAELREMQSMRH